MILVFGASGQVARALARATAARGLAARFLSRQEADLCDPEACAAAIRAQAPRAVINAAAFTAVDRAEAEEALATQINAAAPGAMARACAEKGLPFLHLSTDYVFDGAGAAPFTPEAAIAPLNAYGRSKAAGEAAVRAADGCHAILRTSWVFSAEGMNFVTTMLRLAESRDHLQVVADQIGGPTPAPAIAEACLDMLASLHAVPRQGTWHLSGFPDVSWADFARAIFAAAEKPVTVTPIASADWPAPARRPLNGRLDCSSLARDFGIVRPDWQAALTAMLAR